MPSPSASRPRGRCARGRRSRGTPLLPALLALAPLAAGADTKFQFEAPTSVDGTRWAATAQLGTTLTTGNTESLGISGQAQASRTDRWNRIALAADVGVARSRVTIAADLDGEPGVGPGELQNVTQTTREAWGLRSRYDRFLNPRSSLYVSATIGADRPSGKRLAGGGQLGYGVDLLAGTSHTLRVEAGYDLTYEDQLTVDDPVEIHSARLFAGYRRGVAEKLSVSVSGEFLTNLNEERQDTRRIAAFDDTRLSASAALTAQVAARLSVAFRVSTAWDGAPAPRPPPPGASYEAGFEPRADRLDTAADLVLITTLL